MTSHAVYIFRDAAGRVLYVGCTKNLGQRLGFHGDSKAWFTEVSTVDVEHLPTRGAALEREAELIEELSPPYGGGVRVCRWCDEVATHYYYVACGTRCVVVCETHTTNRVASPLLPPYRSGLPDGDSRHGTRNGYANHSCRCEPCTQANTEYIRAQRARADERASA